MITVRNIPIYIFLTLIPALFFLSCEKDNEPEYQNGYPSRLAGNWVAVDYQIPKENYFKVIDTINTFNLSLNSQFEDFVDLLDLISESEEYSLVSALDPGNTSQLIINNIYNSGTRARVATDSSHFNGRFCEQLDLINYGGYGIYYISVSGQIAESTEGDVLCSVVGLYDKDKNLFDSFFVFAFRKTGFEDAKYRSLLDK